MASNSKTSGSRILVLVVLFKSSSGNSTIVVEVLIVISVVKWSPINNIISSSSTSIQ